MKHSVLHLVVLGGLFLVGCSASVDGSSATSSSVESSSSLVVVDPDVGATSTEAQTTAADPEVSVVSTTEAPATGLVDPLTSLLGVPRSRAEAEELQRDVLLEREEFVVSCMAALGHEYIPDIRHNTASGAVPLGEPRYYGITDNLEVLRSPPEGGWVSPNLALLDGLSPEERDAWYAAFSPRGGAIGCQKKSFAEFPDIDSIPGVLAEEIFDLDALIETNSDVVAAWESWSLCMAAQGYRVDDRNALLGELDELMDQVAANGSPVDGLLQEESAAFVADQSCSSETMVDAVIDEVRFDVRTQYAEENGDRIALLLAEHREGSG